MSRLFDLRHRWGDPVQTGATITRTCRACGRVDSYETLIPNSVLEALLKQVMVPNVYRSLIR